ncbi:MAG: hypothetical protein ACREQ1_13485, partial [Woeseiaceae bacterium]
MKTVRLSLVLFIIAGLTACSGETSHPGDADLLLINGRVYTLDWNDPAGNGALPEDAPHDGSGWQPDAEAVAIKGSRIVFVGSTADASSHQGDSTRVVDLAGATVIPG